MVTAHSVSLAWPGEPFDFLDAMPELKTAGLAQVSIREQYRIVRADCALNPDFILDPLFRFG
jgi:hypothetical protein